MRAEAHARRAAAAGVADGAPGRGRGGGGAVAVVEVEWVQVHLVHARFPFLPRPGPFDSTIRSRPGLGPLFRKPIRKSECI